MTDNLWRRLVRGTCHLWHRPDWPVFAGSDWAERIMQVCVTDDFHAKQGRSTGRWVLEAHGRRLAVYLKRHYRLPWWRGLLAWLWPAPGWSPGLGECRHLQWARSEGLAVPAVVAAGEHIGPWGRLQSFLAVEELTGMLPLHQAIPAAAANLDAVAFACWKRGLTAELARMARELHDRRHYHKDFYLCHFFIPGEDTLASRGPVSTWRDRVHLIDLHRLAHHPLTWPLWQGKDLAQLLFSADVEGITPRDRLRFWRLYWDGRRRPWWLQRFVLLKWRRYRRHNDKRAAQRRAASLDRIEASS